MKIYDVSCHQLFIMFASSLDNKKGALFVFSITAFSSIVIPQLLPTKHSRERERETKQLRKVK